MQTTTEKRNLIVCRRVTEYSHGYGAIVTLDEAKVEVAIGYKTISGMCDIAAYTFAMLDVCRRMGIVTGYESLRINGELPVGIDCDTNPLRCVMDELAMVAEGGVK